MVLIKLQVDPTIIQLTQKHTSLQHTSAMTVHYLQQSSVSEMKFHIHIGEKFPDVEKHDIHLV